MTHAYDIQQSHTEHYQNKKKISKRHFHETNGDDGDGGGGHCKSMPKIDDRKGK